MKRDTNERKTEHRKGAPFFVDRFFMSLSVDSQLPLSGDII